MPAFYIQQFGCRATQADGAALERQLLLRGCQPASEVAAADIVVVNTCTVTASADAQARDAIRKLRTANPNVRVIVTGCYAQRAPEELSVLPGVAWVVGNSHKPQIPELIEALSEQKFSFHSNDYVPAAALLPKPVSPTAFPARILTGNIFEQNALLSSPVFGGEGNHTRPTLKIQDGCNSRCSFCVIPFVRGRSRSLPPETVIQEIQKLSTAGYREIVLSGINLGTYGRDLSPRVEFETLLRRILDETAVERLRISSIEPLDVTQDLVDLFASTERIARHFHMPLQSGSDRILAAMHRWYRAEHYARRVELIRERLPMPPSAPTSSPVFPVKPKPNTPPPWHSSKRFLSPTCTFSRIPSALALKLPPSPATCPALSSSGAPASFEPSPNAKPLLSADRKSAGIFESSLFAMMKARKPARHRPFPATI